MAVREEGLLLWRLGGWILFHRLTWLRLPVRRVVKEVVRRQEGGSFNMTDDRRSQDFYKILLRYGLIRATN